MIPIKQASVIIIVLLSTKIYARIDTVYLSLGDSFPNYHTLFSDNTVLKCTIKFDVNLLIQSKADEKYIPAQLIFPGSENKIISKAIQIKTRGTTRKKICNIPPFWLNIQKELDTITGKSQNHKIKVVSHCKPSRIYDDYVLREFLAYQIYNFLSPYSFRVRLAELSYIDSGERYKPFVRWAIFIEPVEVLAERLNAVQINLENIGFYHTDATTTDLLCMWNFMMGNTDWSITGQHNIKVFKLNDINAPYLLPIPYDFDYTGFVNTEYAVPTEGLGLQNVRQRIYVGPCRNIENYESAAMKLLVNKDSIYSIINNFEYLDERNKKDLTSYLDEFYQLIQRPGFIKYHIDLDCLESEKESEE